MINSTFVRRRSGATFHALSSAYTWPLISFRSEAGRTHRHDPRTSWSSSEDEASPFALWRAAGVGMAYPETHQYVDAYTIGPAKIYTLRGAPRAYATKTRGL